MTTKFYLFDQNNSGGVFIDPAIQVYVEADSPEEANERAEYFGVYFDPECEMDCRCCGSRWYEASEWSTAYDEESAIPMPTTAWDEWASSDKVPVQKIFRKD